jgi:uncharacterized protein YgfB (UPF0149 family)
MRSIPFAMSFNDIEIALLNGKALASLLGLLCGTGDLSQDDWQAAAYAIESEFAAIQEALEPRQ